MKKEQITKAVKLTNTQLRQHNSLLRKNMRRIVSCTTDNEKTQERMDEIENIVFGAPTMKAMFDTLLGQGRRIFEIEAISILLLEDLKEFYPEDYHTQSVNIFLESDNVHFIDMETLDDCLIGGNEPILRGNLVKGSQMFFQADKHSSVRSEALVPLRFGDKRLGALGFGSRHSTRFLEGYGSRFLKRLARLISLKIVLFSAMGPEWNIMRKTLKRA